MKKINLITSLSPQKQYEIYRWFWVTVFLCLSMAGIGAYFIVPQIIVYRSLQKQIALLRQQTKDYTNVMGEKDGLKKDQDELHARENKITFYKLQKKNPHQHVAELVTACGDDVQIEAVRFDKKRIEITVICPTVEHANVLIKRLSSSQRFSQVKMVSLQQDEQAKTVRCVLTGNVIL